MRNARGVTIGGLGSDELDWHSVAGRKALYLDPAAMSGIEGLSDEEGDALIAELTDHATRPEFIYRHEWKPGDVVMWDNGFLMHSAQRRTG